jgi:hypothetical protein
MKDSESITILVLTVAALLLVIAFIIVTVLPVWVQKWQIKRGIQKPVEGRFAANRKYWVKINNNHYKYDCVFRNGELFLAKEGVNVMVDPKEFDNYEIVEI